MGRWSLVGDWCDEYPLVRQESVVVSCGLKSVKTEYEIVSSNFFSGDKINIVKSQCFEGLSKGYTTLSVKQEGENELFQR